MVGNETHAQRVANDPDGIYRWHKNRKKTIRQAYQRGRLTAGERAELLAQALKIKREMRLAAAAKQRHKVLAARADSDLRRQIAAEKIAAGDIPAAHITGCNEECVGAKGYYCKCPCEGKNHGAGNGILPWQVSVAGKSFAAREAEGAISAEDMATRAEWLEGRAIEIEYRARQNPLPQHDRPPE